MATNYAPPVIIIIIINDNWQITVQLCVQGEEVEVPNGDGDGDEGEDELNYDDDMDDDEASTFIKYASRKDRYHHC